jgi:Rps23 Pro-64 3,4-dihydroxylase Tpa1-like proline 4-hydroxylase
MKKIAPGIVVFEKAFVNPDWVIDNVEMVSKKYPKLTWTWAKTSSTRNEDPSVQDKVRSNKIFNVTSYVPMDESGFVKKIDDYIFKGTTNFVGEYCTEFEIGNSEDEGYSILKYEDGSEYREHYDCGPDTNKRVFSMLVYLNDNYEGGEIEFVHFDIKYKPSAGDVLFFPSSYSHSHIAHPVSYGTKYAIVTWLGFSGCFSGDK